MTVTLGEEPEVALVWLLPTGSLPGCRVSLAPTIPREMRAFESYVSNFDPARLGNLRTPTLIMLGGDSPALEKVAAEDLDTALPDSRIAVVAHQGHLAHRTAPGVFVREVMQVLMQA